MYSFHKKNENKYIYHDNPQAKKILQEMMDKALFGASTQYQQQMMKRRSTIQPDSVKRARLEEGGDGGGQDQQLKGTTKKPSGEEKNENGNESAEGGTTSGGGQIDGEQRQQSIDEETDAQLNAIFGRRNIKSEFDDLSAMDDGTPSMNGEEDELADDNSHQLDALQNVAAMFSASGGSNRQGQMLGNGRRNSSSIFGQPKRVVRNRPGPISRTSKRRVIGECSRCHKPITAGARQMHMFFHLAKDMNSFRFRCKHAGCPVEHYRKDQMENHQSKVHGRVDPTMMDDRTQELYNLVQKMSMELLGTTGNTPGPTAAKAQILYDQQMAEMNQNFGPRRRSSNNAANGGSRQFDSANRKIEDLECQLCHKNIMSRIRGFHILWHLNNDLGIVRYGCKFCNFKHDRPQSVNTHGSRDHGVEDCCEDLLYNFEDELKSMSKACFGVERLFEKEIRRRIKMERDGDSLMKEEDDEEEEESQNGSCSQSTSRVRRSAAQIAVLKVPLKAENSDRSWASSTPKDQVKKRRGFRRFGTRRTKSRRAKEEMIKLREVSMRLGGAQYFKKKTNEAVPCEKCGKLVSNRLSDHAYTHLDGCDLFRCQQCNLGHYSRETIVRHLRDFHNTINEPPLDNRLRFAQEIKDAIRGCYPTLFVDAPIPVKEDIEKLKSNLKMDNMVLDDDDEEEKKGDDEEEEEEGQEEEEEADGTMDLEENTTGGNDETGLNNEEEEEGVEEMILMDEEEEHEEEEEEHDFDEDEVGDEEEEEEEQQQMGGNEEKTNVVKKEEENGKEEDDNKKEVEEAKE